MGWDGRWRVVDQFDGRVEFEVEDPVTEVDDDRVEGGLLVVGFDDAGVVDDRGEGFEVEEGAFDVEVGFGDAEALPDVFQGEVGDVHVGVPLVMKVSGV